MHADILIIECDVPEGQTLRDWRRMHPAPGPRRPVRHLLRRALRVL